MVVFPLLMIIQMLNDRFKEVIKKHALHVFPQECCGLICERNGALFILPCPNIHKFKTYFFKIDTILFNNIKKSFNIKCIYHSHGMGNEKLSQEDIELSFNFRVSVLCYSVLTDEFSFFDPQRV